MRILCAEKKNVSNKWCAFGLTEITVISVGVFFSLGRLRFLCIFLASLSIYHPAYHLPEIRAFTCAATIISIVCIGYCE